MAMTLTSRDFEHNGEMPVDTTCAGKNLSPMLAWQDAPEATKSFALIVDDPDAPDPRAPRMTWVHWVLYNLAPTATELPHAVQKRDLPPGTVEGQNDWKRTGWGGPCPPIGRHRYFHKLYALDTLLTGPNKGAVMDKARLEKAMEGHILARAELIGTYAKKSR